MDSRFLKGQERKLGMRDVTKFYSVLRIKEDLSSLFLFSDVSLIFDWHRRVCGPAVPSGLP